ncbi:NTP pyrophosphohydrolase including oxidative damage repair enzymes [Longilinea arvoryzae]|uniref:NTP pyrophosphohydrolase including oxidative damage repair enzymes n=1 Tax=Longilinea arvoryzae TaxID=360412 RepID=A0A0S7BB08_9CHLR|nr:NUDIX hydrolase [Longilinea arvoryzae]GAP12365.1 NTP pyrophosphohydrolase including oxidative damage repair enzymes [Longilinea arvoryzae]
MIFEELKRDTVYQGRAFGVQVVHLRLPDDRVRDYDLVHHMPSVTIVPLDEKGRLLFVRQFRLGAGEELLELPAGVMEAGEEPLACAEREVREETGYAAGKMELLGDFYLAPGYSDEHMYVYLATGLQPDPLKQDDDEFLELEAIPAGEVLAGRNTLHDSKTLAALLLAQPRLLEARK